MRSQADISMIEKYMKPSGSCQVCLSGEQHPNDFIITCGICRSCIHQTHYGSQLVSQAPEVWQCQRCRTLSEDSAMTVEIECSFCPNVRGIMKQYIFEGQKIWLHPECAGWGFPIIFFATAKKQMIRKEKPKSPSTEFWVKDYEANPYPCQVCSKDMGFRLKCKYYSCTKSYHVTCGRSEGVVRDLESMKIESSTGYFPLYCRTHIELKIEDYKKRGKLLKEKGQNEKAMHFLKVSQLFSVQKNNMMAEIKRYQSEEEMIHKMSIQTRRKAEGHGNLNLSDIENSFASQESGDFIRYLQNQIVDEGLPVHPYNIRSEAGTAGRSLNNHPGEEVEMEAEPIGEASRDEEAHNDNEMRMDEEEPQPPSISQHHQHQHQHTQINRGLQMSQQLGQQGQQESNRVLNEYEKYFDNF